MLELVGLWCMNNVYADSLAHRLLILQQCAPQDEGSIIIGPPTNLILLIADTGGDCSLMDTHHASNDLHTWIMQFHCASGWVQLEVWTRRDFLFVEMTRR